MLVKTVCSSFILLIVIASSRVSAQTQVPNEFQAGQPASSAEVNENFNAVESGIDSNSTQIASALSDIATNQQAIQDNASSIAASTGSGVGVFSQGIAIGSFLSMRSVNSPDTGIIVVSPMGYIFVVSTAGVSSEYLHSKEVLYSELNCTGNSYIQGWGGSISPKNLGQWPLSLGVVVKTGSEAYYTARGSSTVSATIRSTGNSSSCGSAAPNTITDLYQVFPNDEGVTGVSDLPPVGPLTIGSP